MWRSEDDVLKDIASLSDFGSPNDKESYKILYSVGRGLNAKEKPKTSEKFIDTRTGEAINLEDTTLDTGPTSYKSKGRGSLVGSLFRTKLQLQQQLRLARPLGSSDEAIESYYGRGRSQDSFSNSRNPSDFEFADKNSKISVENHNGDSKSNKKTKRVIATRNSSLQTNALITSLLSKHIEDSDATVKKDFINDIKHEQSHSNFNNSEKHNKNGNVENSASSDSDFSDSNLPNNWNEKAFKKNLNNCKGTSRCLKKKYSGEENFKVIDDDNSEEEEEEEEEKAKGKAEKKEKEKYLGKRGTNLENLGKIKNNKEVSHNDRDMKYKALGERLNRLRKNCWSTLENGSCNSTSFFNTGPTEKVILIDEDFPPLPKS